MQDVRQIVEEELGVFIAKVKENLARTGTTTTGATERSLRYEIKEDDKGLTATVYGRPFFASVETGSKPWANQYPHAPKFFADIIKKWIDAKGLDLNPFAVATTIMRDGSKLFREGGRTDIYTDLIQPTTEAIGSQVVGFFKVESKKMTYK